MTDQTPATTLLERDPRTTPDNPATSSGAADNSLRERLAAAVESEVYEFRERTMFWEETGGVTEEIARLATRGAMEVVDQQLAANAAQLICDQAALAQVRLLIAAHRPRLQLADPILLGKLERVVAQVGELEAAGGGPLEKEGS